MATAKSSNDRSPIRHDNGSLFAGLTPRTDIEDSQITSVVGGNVIISDMAQTYRVVYKAVGQNYAGTGDFGITVREDYVGEFVTAGDSSANDYMLDWTNSRFNSVSLEYWDDVTDTWVIGYKYAMTNGLDSALPNRNTTSSSILLDIVSDIPGISDAAIASYNPTLYYNSHYYASWEYQCALYNWQYPEGSSVIQYLFGDDNLTGTRRDDVMTGGAGNDTINGGAGNDVLFGSFGADTLYGGAGSDTIVFDGSSSVWDYDAVVPNSTVRGAYLTRTIDVASGGTGRDFFVFDLPSFNFHGGQSVYPALPDLYGAATGGVTNYNPFMSQSHNSTAFSTAPGTYNVSPLTFRTRVLDFKVGEDKLDLTNYGIDLDFINIKALSRLSGNGFITAANTALKPDGYALMIGKSLHTSNNTTLFVIEAGVDTNLNGKTNDTLLEIQLVGITNTAIGIRMFGDAPADTSLA